MPAPVRPGLPNGYRGAHHHEHGAEQHDGLVQGHLGQQASLGARALQKAQVEHCRDDVVGGGAYIEVYHRDRGAGGGGGERIRMLLFQGRRRPWSSFFF